MKKWYNSKIIKLNSKTIIKQNKGKLEPWIFILNHSLEWMKWWPNSVELMLRALSFSRESPICFRSCRRNSGVSWPFSIPNQTIFNFRRFIRSNQRIRMWNRTVGMPRKVRGREESVTNSGELQVGATWQSSRIFTNLGDPWNI